MIFYRKLKSIQAISFDLDDTLYENTSIIVQAEKSLMVLMHQDYPITQSVDKLFWRKQQIKHLTLNPNLKNDMSYLRQLSIRSGLQELGLSGKTLAAATEHCYAHFYQQRSNFKINKNIHSLLTTLAEKLPLVAITNGNVNLQQIGLQDYFSACFKASIDMPMKPHSAMFDASQAFLKMPAETILHVGDNLLKDVKGGLQAGYQTAWYAHDRQMNLNTEPTHLLPHIQLNKLEQLLKLL
jgi:putative hydrolase of the HAD superfamily